MSSNTKVTIINDKDNKILKEYSYSMLINAKSLAEKEFKGVCVHSEIKPMIYEKYWIKIK